MQAAFRLHCWSLKPAADPQAVVAVLRRVGLVTDDQRMKKRRLQSLLAAFLFAAVVIHFQNGKHLQSPKRLQASAFRNSSVSGLFPPTPSFQARPKALEPSTPGSTALYSKQPRNLFVGFSRWVCSGELPFFYVVSEIE